MTKVADERAAQFVLLRRDGLLDWQIAELFDLSSSAVGSALYYYKRRGGDVPSSPYTPDGRALDVARAAKSGASAQRERRLVELAAQGADRDTIARELGVTAGSLRNISARLRKRGVDVPRLRRRR